MASETPIVKLLADGGIECAKGLELAECGYKPGSKVCGKCGAKAVTQTEEAVPADVLTAALYTRFRSRKDHTFAEKVLSAMRKQFGGHKEPGKA